MTDSRQRLPAAARLLLRILLPRCDYDSLIACYEKDYLEMRGREGRAAGRRRLRWQIQGAFPVFFKTVFSGEITMIGNYLKTAFRNIIRHKGYAFINITGLSIGLTCCLLIFLWVSHEWSTDRHHTNREDIFRVVACWPRGNDTGWTWRTPPPLAAALKADIPEVGSSSFFYPYDGVLVEQKETRFTERIGFTDSSLFDIFTLPLRSGIPENLLADPQSVVISAAAARKYFGEEDPLGQALVIDDDLSFRVSAVMEDIPADSVLHCALLIPFRHLEKVTGTGHVEDWGNFGYNTFVLLRKTGDADALSLKLKDYLDIKWEDPENDTTLMLEPLTRIHLYTLGGGGPIVFIWMFSAIAVFILLIACVNFMNLATARSATRAREIGVRKVVGADRGRIVQQFLSESLLLSLVSLAAALVLVGLLSRPLAALAEVPPGGLALKPGVIPIFLLISMLTGLIAGSYPAFFLSSFRPTEVMKGRQRSGSPFFRKTLVVFQFTVSVVLLIGMLVISRQIDFMSRKPLGFGKEHVIYIPMNADLQKRFEPFRRELLREPALHNVCSASNYLGRSCMWSTSGAQWEGRDPEDGFGLSLMYADFDFAETFGLEMTAGRFYSRSFAKDAANFVLNQTAVRQMGVADPIGMPLTVAGQEGRIIGVIKDFHFEPLRSSVRPLAVIMNPLYFRYAALRIDAADIPGTLRKIETVYRRFSPRYPFEFRFLDEVLDRVYRSEQRSRRLLQYFVVLAGLISCLGLFGLASFTAQRRTKEIGVRKVLGASDSGIFLLLSRSFIRWVLAANLIGWPIAYFAMNRWLESFAYRAPVSWISFAAAGLLSMGIALLTVSWQSLRTARTDPVRALRYE